MKTCRTCTRELIGEEICGGQCFVCRSSTPAPVEFLESSRIQWRRDWDAVAVGFIVGLLCGVWL